MKAGTNLEKVLESGGFAVTAEVGPPKSASSAVIRRRGELVRNSVDAVNVTDNQTAVVRMSSLAGCTILKTLDIDPVMQIVCRDRNRIAIQSDVLGAVALGIGNILCLSGDHQKFGNHPSAKGVFDIDSIQLIQTLQRLRDEKKLICDEDVSGEVPMYIGAAANPFADPLDFRVDRLEKKIFAGVEFIQTQSVYNMDRFSTWMDEVRSQGFDKQVHILAGVTPLKSVKMTERMKFHVPGVDIPDEVYRRMKDAGDPRKEGYAIAVELLHEIKKLKGVHGVHITALFWEDIIPVLVRETGLLPRV